MIPLAAISFANAAWFGLALAAAALLVPLTWLALRPAGPQRGARAFGLGLRALGIALLLLCLLDPQWVSSRPKKGANLFAILADNSQGLQVADAHESISRGAKLRTLLTEPGAKWLEAVADNFQVRPYIFDRDLKRVRDFSELDFQGNSTALGGALKKLRERLNGQPLAGILLFTDGNATDLPNGLGETGGVPIYPVVVGSADGLRDVRVERADMRLTAFDDAPVSLTVAVAGQGAVGRDLSVTVRRLAAAGTVAAENLPAPQTTTVANDQDAAEVKFDWRPGGTGIQFYETAVSVKGMPAFDEATMLNNRRAVLVDRGRPAYRILYVGGRPSWEFKFLNRALAEDPQLQLPALIRVANREPKFTFLGRAGETTNPLFRGAAGAADDTQRYDQPVIKGLNAKDETELAAGFPRNAAELFAYDAVILDDIESAAFTTEQLGLLRRFVAERGGGLLMLGGEGTLEDGGYESTALRDMLPVYLDRLNEVVPEGELKWELTREGWLEPWTRVRAVESEERTRLASMPTFLTANRLKSIKPAATVLATITDATTGQRYPALVAQHYGAGRAIVTGVGDLWSWGMKGEAEHADLDRFWRQLARLLVTDVPAPVELRVEPASEESGGMTLRVTARDAEFKPLDLATAKITIKSVGAEPLKPATPPDAAAPMPVPAFSSVTLPAEPVADTPGQYAATFAPRDAGAYLADVEVTDLTGKILGHAQAGWVHDPAAEEFRSLAPNRALLEELARRTGGEVIPWSGLDSLAKKLGRAPAAISENFSEPLWQQGWVFLVVLTCFLSEWGWRRWKGLP